MGRHAGAAEVTRWSRIVTECYCDPGQFDSPHEFFRALTEGLDELSELHGRTPPSDFAAVFAEWSGGDQARVFVCGEVHEGPSPHSSGHSAALSGVAS